MEEYRRIDFQFEGRDAILVFPADKANGKWLLKMEYFGAFQEMERAFVQRGYHLAYLRNINRWGLDEDQDAKARFRGFLSREFGLEYRCVPVGMSSGGLHAIKFAARHPEAVRALYLDAPVVNLLSCPFGIGVPSAIDASAKQEALDALGLTMSQMIAYREHPLDKLSCLTRARIPAVLVYGDADTIVPFDENGRHVVSAYQDSGIPFIEIGKHGCDHHPHGPLEQIGRVIEFVDSVDC
jgi:pimeloyl-ACP methyl ester carboxylesterase